MFSYQTESFLIYNVLTAALVSLIWLDFLMLRKKFVFNYLLLLYLLFIIACMISVFYAINPIVSLTKVRTLALIFILMFSLVNYIDTFEKLNFIMKCLVFSGLITSIYILVNGDFTRFIRFGSQLGNANAIGMSIGTATIFALYYLLKNKNYWYVLIILTNLVVILLTGSRKALLFVLLLIVFVVIFQERGKWKNKIKYFLISTAIILVVVYVISNIPIFYEIIGTRMINMFDFFLGRGSTEGSLNIRSDMIQWGWKWFKERPLFGYGIDNYRFLYGSIGSGNDYSHNNIIELLVGTGIVGAALFYFANMIVIRELLKASKTISKKEVYSLCYCYIAIIAGYMFMSVGQVYYYDKDIGCLLAIGSVIYRLVEIENKN